ncbi:MAG TPA: rhodanese-like domain-containing protein [Rectinemataceae bacterium]|nr:rhodanese-like domain-containing protein [Rectinemataceae bacterium]
MAHTSIKDMIKAGALIVDVRSPGEFADGAYPNAINIPLSSLPAKLDSLGAKDRPIVMYCLSGARSAQGARFLQKAGFTNVVNAGSLEDMLR